MCKITQILIGLYHVNIKTHTCKININLRLFIFKNLFFFLLFFFIMTAWSKQINAQLQQLTDAVKSITKPQDTIELSSEIITIKTTVKCLKRSFEKHQEIYSNEMTEVQRFHNEHTTKL